uniref:Ribosome biogenesis protein BRX1 homolog n=1 Tax=Megaselia scalaris TaxID=36166 RepID=T1GVJ1_MEGSC
MGKRKVIKKSKTDVVVKEEENVLPSKRNSDEAVPKKEKWINKQRVLVLSARGINHRDRHLMKDLRTLMPHHRPEGKMERTKSLSVLTDICEMKHCNKALLFEGRRKRDLYMWLANCPSGPSVKFLVENVHTMGELKLTGNCLRGTRPLLSFDSKFDEIPHLSLLKELLTQIFGVPNYHPKSQPFFDHVYTFTFLDNRIWFRNFQILSEDGGLSEVGPRFVMNPVKILVDHLLNPDYVSPSKTRQMIKKSAKDKYVSRIEQKSKQDSNQPTEAYEDDGLDMFGGDELDAAKIISQQRTKTISAGKKLKTKKIGNLKSKKI